MLSRSNDVAHDGALCLELKSHVSKDLSWKLFFYDCFQHPMVGERDLRCSVKNIISETRHLRSSPQNQVGGTIPDYPKGPTLNGIIEA